MNKTELLGRYAGDEDQRILLGRLLDRLETAQSRSVPTHSPFLSPSQRASAEKLLTAVGRPRHFFSGGYEGAERTICFFPADWQEPDTLPAGDLNLLSAVHAVLPPDAGLTHRDVLGSLMGLGVTREAVGDILVGEGVCDVIVLKSALPIFLSQWESVGRYRISPVPIPLEELSLSAPQVKVIRDTVATLRLDAVAAAGFSLSRGKAADLISAGRFSLNHQECDKPDKTVAQGDVISCRGLGKCVLKTVGGKSKKGRVMLELERYV